jgi:hypothetical protein
MAGLDEWSLASSLNSLGVHMAWVTMAALMDEVDNGLF